MSRPDYILLFTSLLLPLRSCTPSFFVLSFQMVKRSSLSFKVSWERFLWKVTLLNTLQLNFEQQIVQHTQVNLHVQMDPCSSAAAAYWWKKQQQGFQSAPTHTHTHTHTYTYTHTHTLRERGGKEPERSGRLPQKHE